MKNLPKAGRIFYGTAMAGMGLVTIYRTDFPYMMIPYKHAWIPALGTVAVIFGAFLGFCGFMIAIGKNIRPVSLVLGTVLLLIFCFYFVPYQLVVSENNMHFGDWENAAKELALAGGALVMVSFSEKDEKIAGNLGKLVPLGTVLFSLTIISFSFDHFLYAVEAADYVPSWIPFHLFWIYFCGAALFGSGFVIILKIKPDLAATLLGVMIFTWFVILHIPRIVVSPALYLSSEIASAMLALAYSGIALVIAGAPFD